MSRFVSQVQKQLDEEHASKVKDTKRDYQLRRLDYLSLLEDWRLRKRCAVRAERRAAEATPKATSEAPEPAYAPFADPAGGAQRAAGAPQPSADAGSRPSSEQGRTPAGAAYRSMPDSEVDNAVAAELFPDVESQPNRLHDLRCNRRRSESRSSSGQTLWQDTCFSVAFD